jgi:D-beta-D-heptose 7-phosphate kinase/D-beta-D-heptose 1-phosphate adenosyltransferase
MSALKVFTNGCFDILHAGHIHLFKTIKELYPTCRLIVGLNSDESIKHLKGENRPINNQIDRMDMLLSIRYIDEVIIFNETTPQILLFDILPDIIVKGGDYYNKNIIGADICKVGITIIKFASDISTTKLIDKIRETD